MIRMDETVWCDGCGTEITWGPIVVQKRRYCCPDCSEGLKCDCGVRMEIVEENHGSQPSPFELSSKTNF
ncbi:MAG TPA: TRASH domain-containing protein [Anaerolineales bacterium]|nr:TRASH domain-containing protein [Anaerolineales bacterium]